MKALNQRLKNEIEDFREVGHKFLNGEISVADFKKVSGGMGVYAHRDKQHFMIRLRIPSGMLNLHELEVTLKFAKRYGLEGIHLTTRQAIQLHGLTIDEICDVMKEALEAGIYTRGAGGNFPRNIAMSPLAGVEKDEPFDVSIYARQAGDYLLQTIDQFHLPRKLKIAFSSTPQDEGQCSVQDMGFMATTHEGEPVFKLYLGGGLGKNPRVAEIYPEYVKPEEVCVYVEAMVEFFKAEGDYTNKNKARVRYILERMGKEAFMDTFKKHVEEVRKQQHQYPSLKTQEVTKKGQKSTLSHPRVILQKQPHLYGVYVHPVGGQLKTKDLEALVELMKTMEDVSVRLTMKESFYVINLTQEEAEKVLQLTQGYTGTTKLQQSVACIGVPTCQMGILESQHLLHHILDYFKEKQFTIDCLPQIQISGCPNCCGMHFIGGIGFSGKKKKINGELKNVYSMYIGGKAEDEQAVLGHYLGDLLEEAIPDQLYQWAIASEATTKEEYMSWVLSHTDQCFV